MAETSNTVRENMEIVGAGKRRSASSLTAVRALFAELI